jgi:hypothetical protein
MRRSAIFLSVLAAVLLVTLSVPGGAQTTSTTTSSTTTTTTAPAAEPTVSGTVACAPATGYTITWTLDNPSASTVEFMGAEMSGAATGAVELAPSVIDPGGAMSGTATVVGSTKGTVTLAVSTLMGDAGSADFSGSVDLAGTCVPAAAAPAAQAAATFTG